MTGKFKSANISGSDAPVNSDKVSQNPDPIIDSHVDVIPIDRSDISDLTNINSLSARLLQSEEFLAPLLQAVQRAQQPKARTHLPSEESVDFPGYNDCATDLGRLPYP